MLIKNELLQNVQITAGHAGRTAVTDYRSCHALEEIADVVLRCRVQSQDILGIVQRSTNAVAIEKTIELRRPERIIRRF